MALSCWSLVAGPANRPIQWHGTLILILTPCKAWHTLPGTWMIAFHVFVFRVNNGAIFYERKGYTWLHQNFFSLFFFFHAVTILFEKLIFKSYHSYFFSNIFLFQSNLIYYIIINIISIKVYSNIYNRMFI